MDGEAPSDSIAAVAARIQEQALQLGAERATLAVAKADLEALEATYDEESTKTMAVRRLMLTAVRERHGIELELMNAEEKRLESLFKAEQNRLEAEELGARTQEMQDEWEGSVRRVYAEHHVCRQIFERTLERQIRDSEDRNKQRDAELRRLLTDSKRCAREEQSMATKTQQLKSNVQKSNDGAEAEDEEIANLAAQVRKTISTRNEIRRQIVEAKEELHDANNEMTL